MDFASAQLHRLLFDRRPASPTFDGPQQGVVVSATSTTCYVTIAAFSADVSFGPAPYPLGAATPTKGTKCLVAFVGPGVDKPYVLAFYP